MTRKTCKRRHYPLVNPIKIAIEGAAIASPDLLDRLRLLELSAIESFAKGQATPADWRAVADFANIAETMGLEGIGPEALESVKAVDAALCDSHARYSKTGSLGMTGPQLHALRELYAYHDAQRTSIARSEYERLIVLTGNRIRSAHPSLKVFINPKEPA